MRNSDKIDIVADTKIDKTLTLIRVGDAMGIAIKAQEAIILQNNEMLHEENHTNSYIYFQGLHWYFVPDSYRILKWDGNWEQFKNYFLLLSTISTGFIKVIWIIYSFFLFFLFFFKFFQIF